MKALKFVMACLAVLLAVLWFRCATDQRRQFDVSTRVIGGLNISDVNVYFNNFYDSPGYLTYPYESSYIGGPKIPPTLIHATWNDGPRSFSRTVKVEGTIPAVIPKPVVTPTTDWRLIYATGPVLLIEIDRHCGRIRAEWKADSLDLWDFPPKEPILYDCTRYQDWQQQGAFLGDGQ